MWRLNNKHATEQRMGQRKKIKSNQNISWAKGKWKDNIPKFWNASKAIPRGKFIEINAYIKKKERYQINNLILHLKE